jgi:hypothetical protein
MEGRERAGIVTQQDSFRNLQFEPRGGEPG